MGRKNIGFDDKEIDRAIKMLLEMPKQVGGPTISSSASKALLPAKNRAKQKIAAISTGETNKALQLIRNVKVKRNRKKQAPGAKLWLDGPDVYVDNRFWTARGFGKLLSGGASNRRQRTTGKSTGDFKGYGNFIIDSAQETLTMMHARFKKSLLENFKRSKKKVMAKYGRR